MRHSQRIGVVIVDRSCMRREGLRAMAEGSGDLDVLAASGSVAGGTIAVLQRRPDVTLVGTELADGRAVDLIRALRRTEPSTRFVVVSRAADDTSFLEVASAGAAAYLDEEVDPDRLLAVLRLVAAGQRLVTAEALAEVRERMREARAGGEAFRGLTGLEARILDLVVEGATNAEIANRLCLAEKTVRNYMSVILAKAGVRNRTELAAAVYWSDRRRSVWRAS